jgi:hypothetical protein
MSKQLATVAAFDPQEFASRIREEMARQRLSFHQAAVTIGIPKAVLVRAVNDNRKPNARMHVESFLRLQYWLRYFPPIPDPPVRAGGKHRYPCRRKSSKALPEPAMGEQMAFEF